MKQFSRRTLPGARIKKRKTAKRRTISQILKAAYKEHFPGKGTRIAVKKCLG